MVRLEVHALHTTCHILTPSPARCSLTVIGERDKSGQYWAEKGGSANYELSNTPPIHKPAGLVLSPNPVL